MFRRLRFAITYALRNMRRDRQGAAFALFSIAVGVATVIALRMLGLMLTDALTDNVRALLRGDISVSARSFDMRISFLPSNRASVPFNDQNIPAINKWAADHGIDIQYSLTGELMQTATVRNGLAGRPAFVQGYFIDPKTYPFYNTIRADFPAGVALADLFDGPGQIVVGRRVADQLGIKVGDTVRIGAAKDLHLVKGIVPDTSESQFTNPFSLLFSFVYLDRQYADQFGLDPKSADFAFLRTQPGTSDADLKQLVRDLVTAWPRVGSGRGGWSTDTAADVLARNQQFADLVSRFVLLLSLIALIIGGVSIVNTMLVSVNRRSTEVAVLKTLGLKGRGVLVIFLVEALMLGLIGSILGIGLGLLLSLVARTFGEQAFGIALPWNFHIEPLILGVSLGLITTAIFSTLPTLMAAQVRPSTVLRQGSILVTRAGCIPSLISLTVLIVGIGALVDAIVGNPFDLVRRGSFRIIVPPHPGIYATLLTFIVFGIIMGLMWILVWLLGKLPSFRNPSLRIAIRGLTLYRSRTALSLLALIVGMSALGGTLIMSRSINLLLQSSISGPLGGNVIALPLPVPLLNTAGLARLKLNTAPGVVGYRDVRFAQTTLTAIDGDTNYKTRLSQLLDDTQSKLLESQLNFVIGVNIHGNPPRAHLIDGRYLTPEDAGKNLMTIPYKPELETLGVKVGSILTYLLGGESRQFQIVGIVAADPQQGFIPFSLGDGAMQTTLTTLPSSPVVPDLIIASVMPDQVSAAMAVVGTAPGVFVFDVGIFDSFINRLLNQLAALPLLVAGLSLFAAGVLIATTVSLATIERRRQIGILKALGVKRWQALNQLLIENGIIGVVGGVMSLLPTLLVIQAIPALTENVIRLPLPLDLVALMLFLSVAITLGATVLTAWSASGEKPLEVLRYE